MARTKAPLLSDDKSEELIPTVESGDLTINSDSLAHILSRLTDMYTDPIGASVRETISNALDATMKISEEDRKPVEVSVGQFDETFTVRDYGIGMTLEQVKENFLKYGSSTKADDFSAVGNYGLGAKSPLSYTSEFTVTSTSAGFTTAFKLSNTAAGFKFEILSHRETNRESGTMVAIPMKTSDQSDFLKAARAYQRFSLDLPIIVNDETSVSPYYELGTILLDEEEGLYGRVFALNDDMTVRALTVAGPEFSYVLSGYKYKRPANERYYRSSLSENVIVELLPGLVDFTSSRDDIARTARSTKFDEEIEGRLRDSEFIKRALKVIAEHEEISVNTRRTQITSFLRSCSDDEITLEEVSSSLAKVSDLFADTLSGVLEVKYLWYGTKNPTIQGTSLKDILSDFDEHFGSSHLALLERHLTVVAGVSKDNIRKVYSARSRFVRQKLSNNTSRSESSGTILFAKTSLTQNNVDLLKEWGIEYFAADDFIAEAKKAAPVKSTSHDVEPRISGRLSKDLDKGNEEHAAYETSEEIADFAKSGGAIVFLANAHNAVQYHSALENASLAQAKTPVLVVTELTKAAFVVLKDNGATFYRGQNRNPRFRSKIVKEHLESVKELTPTAVRSKAMERYSLEELVYITIRSRAGFWMSRTGESDELTEKILGIRPIEPQLNRRAYNMLEEDLKPALVKRSSEETAARIIQFCRHYRTIKGAYEQSEDGIKEFAEMVMRYENAF